MQAQSWTKQVFSGGKEYACCLWTYCISSDTWSCTTEIGGNQEDANQQQIQGLERSLSSQVAHRSSRMCDDESPGVGVTSCL